VKLAPICGRFTLIGLLLALAACGDGGGGGSSPPLEAQVSTLAYVVTRCHEEKGGAGYSGSQALWVRQGDREPLKVAEFAMGQPPIGGLCRVLGDLRNGSLFTVIGAFQRLGVSPDGSTVVFEVSDDFSILSHVVTADQQGIFAVRADGSGLHRVADHSNDPAFHVDWACGAAPAKTCTIATGPYPLQFSPDGRRVVLTDLGPSDTGDDAPQVFTVDLASGARQQLTHIPPVPECRGQSDDPPDCVWPGLASVSNLSFLDDTTVAYGIGRDGSAVGGGVFTVKLNADGTPEGEPQAVPVLALPNGAVVPVFEITGAVAYAAIAVVPGRTPVNGSSSSVAKVFVVEPTSSAFLPGDRVLQLTNYDRWDTGGARFATDGQHVVFRASADPLGTNPSNQCQLFSIDRLGGDRRQLTSFAIVGDHPRNCEEGASPGCTIYGFNQVDLRTGALVFDSTCDPVGTNPHDGNQLFALRPDGTGLRQLTYTQGIITHPDRSIDVELPGPFHIPSRLR